MANMNMGASGTAMNSSQMYNVFFSSTSTPLYSAGWMPKTTAGYAGTCIFLVCFTIIFRSLFAIRANWENRWRDQAYRRRYIVVADKQPTSERMQADADLKTGVLTVNGVDENIKVVTNSLRGPQPWRFSQDLPRAALYTVIVGVGYLLMLAVMTLNVGYYLSILAGAFIGELTFGRYIQSADNHH